MKLAILGTRGIPARYGGFETFAERLATDLASRGCDVTVYCEGHGKRRARTCRGVHLRYIPAPALGPLSTVLYDARCLWDARGCFDVVYMLGYGAAPFCLIPRIWGGRVWINPDGLEWARSKWSYWAKRYFRLMEWISVRAADLVIADAEAIASSLRVRHPAMSKCSVISYGCEAIDTPPRPDLLSEWSLNPGSYYLIVCRLEPENHVLEIMRAFEKSHSKRQLVVIGNLRRNRYVDNLISVRDPRIRMVGTVYASEKLACLRYYSFGYFHGHSVGGTNPSLLEAMGCGNLIFAHDNPFNRETLAGCGLYFSGLPELTKAIEEAEADGRDLSGLRRAAMRRAREKYRWSDVIGSYERLLIGVLAKAA